MILLDTDVLIDIALDRHPHSGPASELLDRIEHGAESACIAWHNRVELPLHRSAVARRGTHS